MFSGSVASARAMGSGQKAALLMPNPLAQLVAKHVDAMERRGHFTELSPNDLFHGHFIYESIPSVEQSLADIEKSVFAISYHSAEHNSRWRNDEVAGVAWRNRNPRSLVGFMDGTLFPSLDFVNFENLRPARQRTYKNAGTIFTDDLVTANPEWSDVSWIASSAQEVLKVRIPVSDGPIVLILQDQFLIEPMEGGRFRTQSGVAYDIFLVVSNTRRTTRYPNTPRFPFLLNSKSSKKTFPKIQE